MMPYWLLFAIPAFATVFERQRSRCADPSASVLFSLTMLLIAAMIGLRYEVGGDWFSYIGQFLVARSFDFDQAVTRSDPGYVLLNWLVGRLNGDIWHVNLICGLVFSLGLFKFSMAQPRPWLAVLVAVPYLVIVVAMGYSRQAVAIGLTMWGLVVIGKSNRSIILFCIIILIAATFHKSAILVIPLAALSNERRRIWSAMWIGAATILGYYTLLSDSVDSLVTNYIEARYQSAGAGIRVFMNAAPAAVFILFRSRFGLASAESRLWTIISGIALALVVVFFVSPSSTAVDRMALYVIPLQLFVFSRFPNAMAKTYRGQTFLCSVLVGYSMIVQFVWLNYAAHAEYWLPYQFYPL